ncbi:uncharacterized protein BO72DRAFT_457888 [Aspergillus fijiensis CBS 313.89]|uniref:Uncharacterized protein n=1 Tax=Aspergillus fijiensis CBS 313.89 TaxID=1448319 RepID=A0A8G1RT72_9EURO|nr:uncharacterized protein BO72DRAFT_457888 [Aspergillus fijiensis CBS 313.89]RAK78433.1 hypothetical protein BO72DRAFT_457888 [Aspergillus fijiensis CBS 313.89]
MEHIRKSLCARSTVDARDLLAEELEGQPELCQLEILTEVFNAGIVADERLAEIIHVGWEHMLRNDLWTFKYESLEQYRQLISYRETILPILQRFKRSDRAKAINMRIIMDQWKSPIHQVIPAHMAPTSWSKHLLSLLATLSQSLQSTDEAVSLLKKSIHQRPRRSRQGCTLMPSDVERVLRSLPSVTLARRRLPLDRDPRARRCRVYRSGSLSGNSTAGSTDSASDVALEETNPLLESDQVPEGTMTTGTKHSADCWCSPACFPLRLVFRASQPPIPSDLGVGLLMWAKSMAWSNICNAHLGRLGELRFGASVKSWSRDEIVSQLEIVLSEYQICILLSLTVSIRGYVGEKDKSRSSYH